MQPRPQHVSADEWSRRIGALRVLARELVAGEQEREDLVQGTLAAALERPPRELSWSWLAQVLRRRALDLGRQRALRGASVEFDEHTPARGGQGGDAAEIVARLELHEDLTRELLALPDPYRTTLARRYFDELTLEQIAKLEGAPLKTVKIRLERGRALLRERLRRKHGHDLSGLAPLLLEPALRLSSGGALATFTGSMLMTNKLLLAALAVLGVLAALWFSRSGEAGQPRPDVAKTQNHSSPELDEKSAPEAVVSARASTQTPPTTAPSEAPKPRCDLRVKVLWSDSSPAEGVAIFVRRDDRELDVPRHALASASSDVNGEASFEGLPPGDVLVEVDRGKWERARVEADATREVVVQLPQGVDLVGVVRDPAGHAVAGAEIWLTARYHPYDWAGMNRIAVSGPDGRFQARGLHKSQSIGATLSGRSPSELVDMDLVDKSRMPVEVELVLDKDGVDLRGVVLDSAGAALPGALVCAANRNMRSEPRPDHSWEEPWLPRTVRTDAQGRFELLGLPRDQVRFEVRGRGHALWSEALDLSDGRARESSVQLQVGTTIAGLVTDEEGRPVANAFVRAYAAPLDVSFLGMGQYDDPSLFGSPFCISDAQGRYRLEGAPVGVVHAYATPARLSESAMKALARASAELATTAGQTTEWNPRIERGPTIRGRVLYADRRPMAQTFIDAQPKDATDTEQRIVLHTDEEGRFEFLNLERRAYDLNVQLRSGANAKPLRAAGVWPDSGDLELVASSETNYERGVGVVIARVSDPHGRAKNTLGVMLRTDWGAHYADKSGEVFEFTDLPAGRYQVEALAGKTTVALGEWFELGVDERREAPLLTIPALGRLRLRIERPLQLRDAELNVDLRLTTGGDLIPLELDASDSATLELSEGPYVVEAWCRGAAQLRWEFTVSGDTSLVLTLIEGVWQPLEIVIPEGLELNRVQLQVVDSTRHVWVSRTLYLAHAPRPLQTGVALPPGLYTVTLATPGAAPGQAEFELKSLEATVAPIKIVVR